MTANKKTMYEILEVSPTATIAEIRAAHRRLSLELMSGKSGLSREDIAFRLNLLDVALHTVSVPVLRDEYDAKLAATTRSGSAPLPVKANTLSLVDAVKVNQIAAAIEDSQITALMQTRQFPVKEVSSTLRTSARALKTILRVVIGLFVLGFFIKMGQTAVAFRNAGQPTADQLKAEEKLAILEYYKKHGVRPASGAEAALLEKENQRRELELRAAKAKEQREEAEYRRFVEESRREGDYIHEELVRSEQYEREKEEQRQRAAAEEQRYREEAAQREEREEQNRIANERRRLGLEPYSSTDGAAYAEDSEER